jgi:hypothetical protein
MGRRPLVALGTLMALGVITGNGRAQETPKPEATKPPDAARQVKDAEPRNPGPSATLRVQVVIVRFQDEKKLASLPYGFVVTADGKAFVRMGVDTPVPVTSHTATDKGDDKPATSFQYRNVGTDIDCAARDLGEGRYQLRLTVVNSSALTGPGSRVEGAPVFRRFETRLDPVLRDGQSVQTVAATDPVTGEVVKIDVTMNVVK